MEFSKAKQTKYFSTYRQQWFLGAYQTRKDRRHPNSYWRNKKKPHRHFANIEVRRYRGEIANGSNYKRIGEVMWNWM